ncbi:type II secretion system F family protein [Candidatus Woesearchaeota archaeon]|nr:type II secretion system F family protein [Candidatus Woesearchaeota archaeon]
MNIKKEILKAQKKLKQKKEEREKLKGIQMILKGREDVRHKRKRALRASLDKAGIEMGVAKVSRIMLIVSIVLTLALNIYAVVRFYDSIAGNLAFLAILIVLIWTAGLLLVSMVAWFAFYFAIDLVMYKRRQMLEAVLPDFLQLVAANIRAGMTIDQALWFAVRPRFGILAKEIEGVAKHTFAGAPLEDALEHFVKRYDSKTLERSVNLLIEGVRAGGEIGDLLDKISTNIQETNILKKEMAANVTTYVIFISFATVIAAPFLFGIAYQLIQAISEIFSRVNVSQGSVSGFAIQISEGVVALDDFRTFAIVSLIVTSFFSSIIISTIKKGNVKAGVRYIPMFIFGSVTLFLLVVKLFSFLVTDFF